MNNSLRTITITHCVASCFMVGMIWTVHILHYPLFKYVGEETYVRFQQEHVSRIGSLLFLPWLTEGITLLLLLGAALINSHRNLRIPTVIDAGAMSVVLVISGFWSAPAHGDLADGFDITVHDRLMTANLIRALAWTICGAMSVWILIRTWSSNPHDKDNSRLLTTS